MIKDPRDFDGALSGYNDILKQLEKAKTRDEISTLERRGISAMREVQTSANYIGYKLKAAVTGAYQRLQESLTKALEEKEEPKEEKAKETKPKGRPRKSTKKEEKADA